MVDAPEWEARDVRMLPQGAFLIEAPHSDGSADHPHSDAPASAPSGASQTSEWEQEAHRDQAEASQLRSGLEHMGQQISDALRDHGTSHQETPSPSKPTESPSELSRQTSEWEQEAHRDQAEAGQLRSGLEQLGQQISNSLQVAPQTPPAAQSPPAPTAPTPAVPTTPAPPAPASQTPPAPAPETPPASQTPPQTPPTTRASEKETKQ